MFEGLVRQVLLGYLGQYVKDIQKEQLKITLWNEEVLLENVELILEAFDYLQLPFALKQGRVGRLSIKIPWKKLGWDPIIIVLEDVFISASQRGDQEWSVDAVEKREFAGKKAKLAAAELGKLSRRVCGSHAGQSFISYITAKILDSIQVAIRNFHVLYSDMQNDQSHVMIGLKFSSLTILKQHLTGLSSGRMKVGQVNKTVEIRGLEFYSSIYHDTVDMIALDNVGNSNSQSNTRSEGRSYKSILAPCDVTFMLSANRSEKLDDSSPQYSVNADLTDLVISLDEAQIHQIFFVWDYICTCRLRERYGRYRPWHSPLQRKLEGWPLLWWHYAQESVLSDVRKKLKKTSWRYLGERLSYRRKYINLYKTKLDFLRQEQPVDEDVLQELEHMEKESDLDDILNYRSAAEHEMQEFFLKSSKPEMGLIGMDIPVEKSYSDERNSGKSRGWLNWLSRGMLGAGGTDDSSQFSGVVSDDVIKDIYEATEFHPSVSSNVDVTQKHELCLCAMKFVIHQISATLHNKCDEGTTEIILDSGIIESKLHKEHATFSFKVKSVEMVHPHKKKVILRTKGPIVENDKLDIVDHSCSIQVHFSSNHDVELSVKGKLQQLEVMFDVQVLSTLMEFYDVCTSFKFQNERVLSSLNRIENSNTRLKLKMESFFGSHKKVVWDISILDVVINLAWRNMEFDFCNLVMESRSICFMSLNNVESFTSNVGDDTYSLKNLLNSISTSGSCLGVTIQDLYQYFEVKLNDFQVTIMNSDRSQKISMFEQFTASIFLSSCVIPDKSILKQLEVFVIIELLKAHFCPSMYGAVIELVTHMGSIHSRDKSEMLEAPHPPNIDSVVPYTFGVSIVSKLHSVILDVDLANDGDNSSALVVSLEEMNIRYVASEFEELFVCMKSLMISAYKLKDEMDSCQILTADNLSSSTAIEEDCYESDQDSGVAIMANSCFAIHYESFQSDLICRKCTMCLNKADIHCYPYLVGLIVEFFDKLTTYGTKFENSSAGNNTDIAKAIGSLGLQKFGFSNYTEPGSSESACIPLDHFPFVTIHNSGSFGNLESALLYAIPDWRKYYILRDRKIPNPKINMRRKSKFSHVPFSLELSLCGLRAHFHDSSCIVGTIMLPTSKSSLFFCEDSMDILSSSEGLVLTSSWWTRNLHDYLWGPSSENLSPILNVRVRKNQSISSTTKLEVSIGIQHVYCMLPPEYLSIIIGYFSLSDWSGNSTDQILSQEQNYMDVENDKSITYKFEILDSNLILPIENKEHQFLKVEMQQVYCSYIHNCCSENEIKYVPLESLVPINKLARKCHCLNVFGRDLFLSFILFKNDIFSFSTTEPSTEYVTTALIAPISADVWVRIPFGNEPNCKNSCRATCFMMNIRSCQIIAEDSYISDGCAALWDVIDQFSSVGDQSEYFKSDVIQFLRLKRSSKETTTVSPMSSTMMHTEVNCRTQSLLINFCHTQEDSVELISKADVQFNCSASLINDSLVRLNLGFSSLALYSLHDSLVLAKCTSTCSSALVLDLSLCKSIEGENKVYIYLPSLNIWLHISEWIGVVNFLTQFCEHLAKAVPLDASLNKFSFNDSAPLKTTATGDPFFTLHSERTTEHFASEEIKDTAFLNLKSDMVGVTVHIPVWFSEEPCQELQLAEDLMVKSSSCVDIAEGRNSKFVCVSFPMNHFKLLVSSRGIQLESHMDKLSSTIVIAENRRCTSWPLFEIIQVDIKVAHCTNLTDTREFKLDILCDHSDVWLSHPVFYFCSAVKFNVPEAGTSQFSSLGINFKFQLRKVSFLLTDGRWSCSGPQLEILVKNILLLANLTGKHMECSVTGDFQANYNNIEKVSWEPFIEPWQFQLTLIRKPAMSDLLNSSVMTDILLNSEAQLNINITESLVECVARITEMLMDAWHLMGLRDHSKGNKTTHSPSADNTQARRCAAPYILQNLTSVPLFCHVYHRPVIPDEFDDSIEKDKIYVQPGSTTPIYMDKNTEDQLTRYRPSCSSNSLNEQKSNGFARHYITIQLDGTSVPSGPMSMDLVGVTCFDVNFSKGCSENNEDNRTDTASSFVVPVVFDVSVLHYSKLIRIYSTVVLSNATSTPLELRFDIPLGVSPKILDPVLPGQQLPLPLHLAEAGSLRWRPVGNSYLWSEAHNLSKLLSLDNKLGNFKSFVCYPSHPSSCAFRCCISVRNISLASYGLFKRNGSVDEKNRFVHLIILNAPLVVNNYIPKEILLTSDSGGVNHTMTVSEGETSVYHIDPSHDLGLEICIDGFKPSYFKFPRLETFCTMAKFSETKYSLSETLTFGSSNPHGPMYVTVEKVMDAYSGTREVIIFVPFLLYNCTGFPLYITEATDEIEEQGIVIPSYYEIGECEALAGKKDGLSLVSSNLDLLAEVSPNPRSSLRNHIISTREKVSPLESIQSIPFFPERCHENMGRQISINFSKLQNTCLSSLNRRLSSRDPSTSKDLGSHNHDLERVGPCMYSPNPISSLNDVLVKVSRCWPGYVMEKMPHSLWSSPFSLLPPNGSSNILLPQSTANAAFVLAVTSTSIAEPYTGRINAITFQPRYVISNACRKDICYKQKGTDVIFHLSIGEHAHLHWTDTTRELLISISYNEPGWQWSGGFLPDHLGDTQLKMRNFVSGTLHMIRVEVQNADISMGDDKIVGSIKGNSGTILILLSDDDTGYMPYRIDNFSKERLRIYQQRCEMFETVVHSYTSCLYAWDEPCYPHRLILEVPGERVLGSFTLDDVKEYLPIYLPSTSEKPERTFFLSVHAEGATKVLRVLDSNYHVFSNVKKSSVSRSAEKKLHNRNLARPPEYKEKISIVIPYIGISLINSHSKELIFACIKDLKSYLLQSVDRQSLSLEISFLQIDNQLRSTPYPVMLSFDGEYSSCQAQNIKSKDDVARRIEKTNQTNCRNSSCDPVFFLAISKWRKKDISFISFEYIKLSIADFCLELEQEIILSLFEFFANISSRLQYQVMPSSDCYEGDSAKDSSSTVQSIENLSSRGDPTLIAPVFNGNSKRIVTLPSIVPIGAPWQKIYLLARTQKKIYIEMLELAPIRLTLSFSSAPWMLQNRTLTSKESLIHRGFMALADVEGARIYLKELTIAHHMASWESIQEILIKHYIRQLLHEIYKLFGSAGVIGNPMGFARSMGLGIRDFLSVPAKSIMQSPVGLITGMAQGTTSLLSNTVYAISDATSQFSKAARKGIVAFTYDDQAVSRMEKPQAIVASGSKGVINEVLEGLTGLLQSPIRGAERHGLPGVLSGIALGITGLVAKPAASILEVTGKTALSIRNRSKPNQIRSQRFRVRIPRPLSGELPLRPYSWEEAVGTCVLMEGDDGLKYKDEKLVVCKTLKEDGKFVVLTERFIMIVFCPNLVKLGKPEFCGIPAELEWIIESEIGLESVIHADTNQGVVQIVGSRPDTLLRQHQHSPKRGGRTRAVRYNHFSSHLPLSQTNLELASEQDAQHFIQILLSSIENGERKGWGCGHFLHRVNMK